MCLQTPKKAITDVYVDKKCPFTGNVSIRGRILKGIVVSHKMKRTIVIRRDYLQYIPKYRRYVQLNVLLHYLEWHHNSIIRFEKRHKRISAHCSPCFENVTEGDIVTVRTDAKTAVKCKLILSCYLSLRLASAALWQRR